MTQRVLSGRKGSFGYWLIIAALAVGSANAVGFAWRATTRLARDSQGEREKTARRISALLRESGVRRGEAVLLMPDRGSQHPSALERLAFEMRLRHAAYPLRWRVIYVGSSSPKGTSSSLRKVPDGPEAIVYYDVPFTAQAGWRVVAVGSASVALRTRATDARRARRGAMNLAPTTAGLAAVGVAIAALIGMGGMVLGLLGLPRCPWPVRLALSHLVGTVCLASLATAALCASVKLSVWVVYAAMGAAGLVWVLRRRGQTDGTDGTGGTDGTTGTDGTDGSAVRSPVGAVAAVAIAVGAVAALIHLAGCGLPWDGWSIWELKARALFHDGTPLFLTDPAYDFSHRDYPLAVPIHTWWLYAHFGGVSERIAQFGGLMFAADLAVLTYALARGGEMNLAPTTAGRRVAMNLAPTTAGRRGAMNLAPTTAGRRGAMKLAPTTAGLAAAGLVMTQPAVLRHASSGYADVPFAAFALAAVWCAIALAGPAGSPAGGAMNRAPTAAIGLCVAGCVMTKNEGVPLALIMTLIGAHWVVTGIGASDRRVRAQALWMCGALALLLVLPWWGLTARLGLRGDLLGGGRYPVADAVRGAIAGQADGTTASRSAAIAGAVLRSAGSVGPEYPAWGLAWVVVAVGLGSAVCMRRRDLYLPLAVGGMLTAVYLVVLMRTPHPLAWHLSTSLDRLMLHVLPPGVAGGCCALLTGRLRVRSGDQ